LCTWSPQLARFRVGTAFGIFKPNPGPSLDMSAKWVSGIVGRG
jgi:hypothetical protein